MSTRVLRPAAGWSPQRTRRRLEAAEMRSHKGSRAEAEPGDSKTRLWRRPIGGDLANGQLRRGLGSGRQWRLGTERWVALWRPFGNFRNEAGDLMSWRRWLQGRAVLWRCGAGQATEAWATRAIC